MSHHKKKIFPKISKKIKGFLTDESGKITKKDALGLAVGAVLLSGVGETLAGHTSSLAGHASQGHGNALGAGGHLSGTKSTSVSKSLNGHYSNSPSGGHYNGYPSGGHINQAHVNHGNVHSSHSSHGSRR